LEANTLQGGPLGSNQYYLYEVQFKYPSEHRINGNNFPLEVQFWYRNQNDTKANNKADPSELAAISVFFQEGDTDVDDQFLLNIFGPGTDAVEFAQVISNNAGSGEQPPQLTYNSITYPSGQLNLGLFIPFSENGTYYYYSGSETFPPCRETVTWILMDDVQTLSRLQMTMIQTFTTLIPNFGNGGSTNNFNYIPFNSRPLQALNGRQVRSNANNGAAFVTPSSNYIVPGPILDFNFTVFFGDIMRATP